MDTAGFKNVVLKKADELGVVLTKGELDDYGDCMQQCCNQCAEMDEPGSPGYENCCHNCEEQCQPASIRVALASRA